MSAIGRMDTPASLLERLKEPDALAWDRFVELYTPVLYHWTKRLGLAENDAADLMQEVFLLLLRKLPAFHYDAAQSFRAWLKTVTLNKWRELHRRRPEAAADAAPADVADPNEADPFWEVEYRERLVGRALHIMQSEFEPATWQACWESVVSGKPAKQVARELGITVNAVYLAKSRVLRRLHQELEGLLE
jgi:RNA polymerase sigma-70 factor (ECF subfamily)